jgi:hypothetical protein
VEGLEGACDDMCPADEAESRRDSNSLHPIERALGRTVKKHQRSGAGWELLVAASCWVVLQAPTSAPLAWGVGFESDCVAGSLTARLRPV